MISPLLPKTTTTALMLVPNTKLIEQPKPISLNLREWLTHDNPNRAYLDKLIYPTEASMMSLDTCFSDDWSKIIRNKEASEVVGFLKGKIKGYPVVDLGGGLHGHVESLTIELEASDYIQVDKFIAEKSKLDPFINLWANSGKVKQGETYAALVQADMLDFISRIPDGSANFFINGIDMLIIDDRNYHKALVSELTRATRIGGVVCGVNSEVLKHLPSDHFQLVKFPYLEFKEGEDFDSLPLFIQQDIREMNARPMDHLRPCIFEKVQ